MKCYTIAEREKRQLQNLIQVNKPLSQETLMNKIHHYLSAGRLQSKIIACAAFIENNQASLEKLKRQEQKIKTKHQRLNQMLELLKNEIIAQMMQAKLQIINSKEFSLSLRKTQSRVDIKEPQMIAKDFYKVKHVSQLDKASIKAALLNGVEVPGASLKDVLSVVIQ